MPTIFAIRAPFRALTVALSLLLLAVTAARASGAEPIVIQDYGIYEHRVDRFEPDPQQVSRERVIVSAVTLLRTADEVDAQLGRMFGLQFRIADPALAGETLTIRRLVPPLTNPATGQTATVIERDIVAETGQIYLNAYRFDYDWEMAEGVWRFQVVHKGRVIAEKAIKVVIPMN